MHKRNHHRRGVTKRQTLAKTRSPVSTSLSRQTYLGTSAGSWGESTIAWHILKQTWVKTLGSSITGNNPSTPQKQIEVTAPALFYSLLVLKVIAETPKLAAACQGHRLRKQSLSTSLISHVSPGGKKC